MANANRWDKKNWVAGKVTLANALGLGSWNIKYPQLNASLQNQAVNAQSSSTTNNKSSNPGGSTGGTGAVNGCTASTTAANQRLGQQLAATYGWGSGSEWTAFNNVVMSESGWCNTAQNPTTSAYGIGQFLNTTWSTVGGSKTSNPTIQIRLMLAYIKARYGTPSAAWAFHQANNFY